VLVKIIGYNVLEGATATFAKLVTLIRHEQPDVLCLQEVNGWQDHDFERLQEFASATGLIHYAFGDGNSSYKLAVLSRWPIIYHTVYHRGFGKCVLACLVQTPSGALEVWNYHAPSQSEDLRLPEMHQLVRLVRANAHVPDKVHLLGDFNMLASTDVYPMLGTRLAEHGITKFGHAKPRCDAYNVLTTAGWIDVAAALSTRPEYTVPTRCNHDAAHRVPLRLDYAFVTPLAFRAVRTFRVIRSPLADQISDHYPYVLEVEV
jgi:exodeoxyribonuclease III